MIYSLSQRTSNVTINQAPVEYRAAATNAPSIMEFGLAQVTGTASSYSFGRPAAIGVAPTGPVSFQGDNPNAPTALTVGALVWGTSSPTNPTVPHRRINTPATIGSGIIWTFPRGLIIAASNSICLSNITSSVTLDVWCVIDE